MAQPNRAGAHRAALDDISAAPVRLENVVRELIAAHCDTLRLSLLEPGDPRWELHLEYIDDLQRTARELLGPPGRRPSARPRPDLTGRQPQQRPSLQGFWKQGGSGTVHQKHERAHVPLAAASRYPTAVPMAGAMGHRLSVEFDEFGFSALQEEAERQGVPVEELVLHAAMYYLADLESGRAAAQILRRSEAVEDDERDEPGKPGSGTRFGR